MKFGFYLPTSGPTARPEPLAEMARQGDALGFHSMVIADHIVLPREIESTYPYTLDGVYPGAAVGECLEQLTVLTFLAGITRQIRLVPSVMIVPYRNPVVTAKMLATLDVLSNGRVTLGVGVGWMEEEFQALGLDTYKQRGAVTDEFIELYKELWTKDAPSFHGEHYQISGSGFAPKPVQKPHPPIWIGGHTGPAIRRAAKYGDGWMPIGLRPPAILDPEELGGMIARLRRLTVRAGRPEDAVELTFSTDVRFNNAAGASRPMLHGLPEQIAADLRQYQDLGVSNFILGFASDSVAEAQENMERFSREVMTLVPQD